MPKPHDPSEEALRRLDKDLQTFEAKRAAPAAFVGGSGDAAKRIACWAV